MYCTSRSYYCISPGAQVYTGTGGIRHILAQVNLFSQYFYSFIVNMLFIQLKSRNIENIWKRIIRNKNVSIIRFYGKN